MLISEEGRLQSGIYLLPKHIAISLAKPCHRDPRVSRGLYCRQWWDLKRAQETRDQETRAQETRAQETGPRRPGSRRPWSRRPESRRPGPRRLGPMRPGPRRHGPKGPGPKIPEPIYQTGDSNAFFICPNFKESEILLTIWIAPLEVRHPLST